MQLEKDGRRSMSFFPKARNEEKLQQGGSEEYRMATSQFAVGARGREGVDVGDCILGNYITAYSISFHPFRSWRC